MTASFPKTARTRLRRRPARGFHDAATVFAILDAGMIAHIGYVIDAQPYVTATAYWREGSRLYWHGSAQSRMIQVQAKGIPACVTVSHLDGIVAARSGFHHSLNYRSVMAFGRTELIDGRAAKRQAMDAFLERLFPGRPRELRPYHDSELDAISVIGMTIDEASAKIREGGVLGEEEDYGFPCWAGVIPVRAVIGRAIPDPHLIVGPALPPSLGHFTENARLDAVLSRSAKAG